MSYTYIQSSGVIVSDTADTRAEVEQEWKDALGRQDLITAPDTPQGVLITAETLARQGVARNNADLANQINPNLATGIFLDALAALTGLERRPATRTRVSGVILSGIPQTNIPAGVMAKTKSGDVFALVISVSLGVSGTATGVFDAIEPGPIHCAPGDLDTIVDLSVLGWESITNPLAGVPGDPEMTDDELFMLRRLTLARQGISTVEAQISGLYDIPGVKSLQFRENVTDVTAVIDGITMKPHSVWACVSGGADEDIARSLLNNKTDGAGWNGAISVGVVEPWSGQTYTVLFDRPIEIHVMARVTVKASSVVSVDPNTAVRDAIMTYAAGRQRGERGIVVGANASPFEVASAINREAPVLHISKVEIARVGDSFQTAEIEIAVNEIATITPSSIMVVLA